MHYQDWLIQWNLYNETAEVLLKTHKFHYLPVTILQNHVYSPCLERPPVLIDHNIWWSLYTGFFVMPCTGQLGGPVLKASGRVQNTPFGLGDKSPKITDQHPAVGSVSQITHWGRDKIDAISQTTFSSAYSWMKMFEFQLIFHWSFFLRVQLSIFKYWFR